MLITTKTENHALNKKAQDVDFDRDKEKISEWINTLIETMNENKGIGIAGPQAGINYRIAIVKNTNGQSLVLINPSYKQKVGKFSSKEGCLSLPGELYKLSRFNRIVVENYSIEGKKYEFSSWTKEISRRIQHEMDHLDGVLICNKGKKYGIQGAFRELPR